MHIYVCYKLAAAAQHPAALLSAQKALTTKEGPDQETSDIFGVCSKSKITLLFHSVRGFAYADLTRNRSFSKI